MIPPAAAEAIFHIGSFPITNALMNAWIAVAFFAVVGFILRFKKAKTPHGFQNAAEALVEFLLNEVEKVAGDRAKAKKFLPIVGGIFLFLLFSNWIGLLPGTGSIGIYEMIKGERELVPLLRPAASDLNLTLAMAVFAVVASHVMGLISIGPMNHISKFINIRGILFAFKKGPVAVVVAVIEAFVGVLELIGELAKVLSLSLRLFGNIFAGEVLITVMLGLMAFIVPIPFMLLELLVGAVQATVFAMLTLAYLTVATSHHGDEEEHQKGGRATEALKA